MPPTAPNPSPVHPPASPLPTARAAASARSRAASLPQVHCTLRSGADERQAITCNLSLQGLFLPSGAALPDGASVLIHALAESGELIAARGSVSWSGHGPLRAAQTPGAAIRFDEILVGQELLRTYTRRRFDLLKSSHVPLQRVVPLVLLPMASLPGHTRRIAEYALSPLLEELAGGYEAVGMKHRLRFLWRSTRIGVEVEMLPCVRQELQAEVNDIKTLGAMVDVLMDDIADEVRDRQRLERLLALLAYRLDGLGGRPAPSGDAYADFTLEVWERMWSRIERLPRFAEFYHLLCFDWHQVINSMRFSLLLNEMPSVQNLPEHDAYMPHNMHMMCNATLDLMCAPRFDTRELPVVRRAARVAQRMGRIGNMITTWERELGARDFSSGVFPYLLHKRILGPAELGALPADELVRRVGAAHVERYFLLDWENLRAYLEGLRGECQSVDLGRFAQGLDDLLLIQLASHGLV